MAFFLDRSTRASSSVPGGLETRGIGSHLPRELSMPGSVEEVGLSLVVLSLVFACSALIRRWSGLLRKLFNSHRGDRRFSHPRARPGGDGPTCRRDRDLSSECIR